MHHRTTADSERAREEFLFNIDLIAALHCISRVTNALENAIPFFLPLAHDLDAGNGSARSIE